jgi:Tol biopolymer transport system component
VTRFNENDAMVSPDGKWVAYRSDESGRFEVYVQSFPTPGSKYRVSTRGCGDYGDGFLLRWRGDGKELVYISGDGLIVMAVPIETDPRFHAGSEKVLFKLPGNTLNLGTTMSEDGQRFLAVVSENEGTPAGLSVVLNWPATLDKP